MIQVSFGAGARADRDGFHHELVPPLIVAAVALPADRFVGPDPGPPFRRSNHGQRRVDRFSNCRQTISPSPRPRDAAGVPLVESGHRPRPVTTSSPAARAGSSRHRQLDLAAGNARRNLGPGHGPSARGGLTDDLAVNRRLLARELLDHGHAGQPQVAKRRVERRPVQIALPLVKSVEPALTGELERAQVDPVAKLLSERRQVQRRGDRDALIEISLAARRQEARLDVEPPNVVAVRCALELSRRGSLARRTPGPSCPAWAARSETPPVKFQSSVWPSAFNVASARSRAVPRSTRRSSRRCKVPAIAWPRPRDRGSPRARPPSQASAGSSPHQ